jgi:carbon monoxide dehydrogenase subunit G
MEVTASKRVDAAPDAVWAVMTDLNSFPEAISGIESVERLDDGTDFEIGTKWRETRVMFGRTATEVMWVTEIDPGRSYVVEASSHGAEYRTTQRVAPTNDGGSILTMSFSGKPVSTMAKVMSATIGRFFENATRKAFEQDLIDVAAAAEAASRSDDS